MVTGIFLFCHFFCWFTAVKYTNVSAAAVLASFHPLVVLVLTVFVYKKRVPGKAIIAILIALAAGAYLMCSDISAFSDGRMIGNVLALFAGIFMGIYFAVGGRVRSKMDGQVYVMLIFFWCWVCFTIACIVTGTRITGYAATDYLGIVALAFVCQIGSHALFNLCMGHVDPLYVSAWESMDPVTSTILAVIIASQIPSLKEVICCVIVVLALIAYSRFESQGDE
jgi:drug/metabolite transporter (DMT)-like permease